MARRCPTIRLKRVDLPTLGHPTIATVARDTVFFLLEKSSNLHVTNANALTYLVRKKIKKKKYACADLLERCAILVDTLRLSDAQFLSPVFPINPRSVDQSVGREGFQQ